MKSVDPAKLTIWICLGLAAAGVGSHFWLEQRIQAAEKDTRDSLRALRMISELRAEIESLARELENDQYLKSKSNNQLDTFFEKMARNSGLPRPNVSAPRDDTPRSGRELGFRDTSLELTWAKSGRNRQRFDRERCAKFAWWLENQSKLLKVTSLRLTTDDRLYDDLWEYRLWVTERRPVSADDES